MNPPKKTKPQSLSTKLEVVDLPLNDIKRYSNNPRINHHAVEIVRKSLDAFGFRQPISVAVQLTSNGIRSPEG